MTAFIAMVLTPVAEGYAIILEILAWPLLLLQFAWKPLINA